jgi:hypothetical protein
MPQNNLFLPFVNFNGAGSTNRLGQQRDAWNSDRHGQVYTSVYGTPAIGTTAAQSGMVFRCSNATTVAVTAALATTYTGLCLSNPAASTVNLVLKGVSAQLGPAPATQINLGLITGWSAAGVVTHTTALTTTVNAYVGAATASGSIVQPAAAQGKVDSACTIVGTPLWDRWLTTLAGSPSAGSGGLPYTMIQDDIIIPPGGYVAIGNLIAIASGFLGTLCWEEVAP